MPLCIELLIRAVALDRKDLAILKLNASTDAIKSAEMSLAGKFSKLVELITANGRISTEIVTGVDLHPTIEGTFAAVPLEQEIETEPAATCHMGDPSSISDHIRRIKTVAGEPAVETAPFRRFKFPLESSLNGQTNPSLTRDLPEAQHLMMDNPEFADSSRSDNPLLDDEMDDQYGSETTSSSGDSNYGERLREFDSVLERDTASPCSSYSESEPELDISNIESDEGSIGTPSLPALSEIMDLPDPTSPKPTEEAVLPDGESVASEDDEGPPRIDFPTVDLVSSEEDEKFGGENSVQSPIVEKKEDMATNVPQLQFPASCYSRGGPPQYLNLPTVKKHIIRPKIPRNPGRTSTSMRSNANPDQEEVFNSFKSTSTRTHVTDSSGIPNSDQVIL